MIPPNHSIRPWTKTRPNPPPRPTGEPATGVLGIAVLGIGEPATEAPATAGLAIGAPETGALATVEPGTVALATARERRSLSGNGGP